MAHRTPNPRPADEPAPVRKATDGFDLHEQPCPRCEGSGHEPHDEHTPCRRCAGTGKRIRFSARPSS